MNIKGMPITPALLRAFIDDPKLWDEHRKEMQIYVEIFSHDDGGYCHHDTVGTTLAANFAFSSCFLAEKLGISLPNVVFGTAHCIAYLLNSDAVPPEHKADALGIIKNIIERYEEFGTDLDPKTEAGKCDLAKQKGELQ